MRYSGQCSQNVHSEDSSKLRIAIHVDQARAWKLWQTLISIDLNLTLDLRYMEKKCDWDQKWASLIFMT